MGCVGIDGARWDVFVECGLKLNDPSENVELHDSSLVRRSKISAKTLQSKVMEVP